MLDAEDRKLPLPIYSSRGPPSEPSQQGNLLVLLKSHPAYPARQKPDTGRRATMDGGDEHTRGACMLDIHPDSSVFCKAFNEIFHQFKKEIEALKFATFKQ